MVSGEGRPRPTDDAQLPLRISAIVSEQTYGRVTLTPSRSSRTFLTSKVPEAVAVFWLTKALSTALGESVSDWLVHAASPVPAVLLGFVGFVAALVLQLRATSYRPWRYWTAVAMVGIFGTMAADVLHVGFGVPYVASSALFVIALAAVFVVWQRTEFTLSIHSITTTRRELFYWAAVVATFALGTAVGDLAATTGGLGYGASAAVFALLILVPAAGYRWWHWNPVLSFWFAYVLTRPVGASVADWLGKPKHDGGLGFGSGPVAAVLAVAMLACVAYVARTRADSPEPAEQPPAV
jgi:uncharacterized membrane-anchored protein